MIDPYVVWPQVFFALPWIIFLIEVGTFVDFESVLFIPQDSNSSMTVFYNQTPVPQGKHACTLQISATPIIFYLNSPLLYSLAQPERSFGPDCRCGGLRSYRRSATTLSWATWRSKGRLRCLCRACVARCCKLLAGTRKMGVCSMLSNS